MYYLTNNAEQKDQNQRTNQKAFYQRAFVFNLHLAIHQKDKNSVYPEHNASDKRNHADKAFYSDQKKRQRAKTSNEPGQILSKF